MSMWLHAVWEVKHMEIFVWSGWDNAEGSCETEQTIKQQNKFMDIYVKWYGESNLNLIYKIMGFELTVTTQEKDPGIMFYKNNSFQAIKKANGKLGIIRERVESKHSYAAV